MTDNRNAPQIVIASAHNPETAWPPTREAIQSAGLASHQRPKNAWAVGKHM